MGCKKKLTLLQYISLRGRSQCLNDRSRRLDIIGGTLADSIGEVYKLFKVFVPYNGFNYLCQVKHYHPLGVSDYGLESVVHQLHKVTWLRTY